MGLIVVGLVLGAILRRAGVNAPRLTKDLLYTVFLPGLVFEAAYNLTLTEVRENARAIALLSIPGVVVAALATAVILVTTDAAIPWPTALVFSALISATDPIAVVALFKNLGAPRRLTVLVEGESLVNDGTAAVLFALVVARVTSAEKMSMGGVALQFAVVVLGGALVGIAVALALSTLRRIVRSELVGIALSVATAYGSFALGEKLHLSGIIATLAAGLVARQFAAPGVTARFDLFWSRVALAMNACVFLLMGLTVRVGPLVGSWHPIVLAYVAMTLARAVVVGLGAVVLLPTREKISLPFGVVLTWGGLRGALSMVLALALPQDFPGRGLIIRVTLGVVVVSNVLQGVTAESLLRVLGIVRTGRSAR